MLGTSDHEEAVPADGHSGIQENTLLAFDADSHPRPLTRLRQQGQLNRATTRNGHLYFAVLSDCAALGVDISEA